MVSRLNVALRRLLWNVAGLRLSRAAHEGEFAAMPGALGRLARGGFAPSVIVDVGANVGDWARLARVAFPSAPIVCVEPQSACQSRLSACCKAIGNATILAVAVSDTDGATGYLHGGGGEGNTGAALSAPGADIEVVPLRTLDALLQARLAPGAAVLLKLDVEGHERRVIAGATRLLAATEVVIAEFTAYWPADSDGTTLDALVAALGPHGLHVHDVAGLSRRRRDGRLRQGDVVFVRESSPLRRDVNWG